MKAISFVVMELLRWAVNKHKTGRILFILLFSHNKKYVVSFLTLSKPPPSFWMYSNWTSARIPSLLVLLESYYQTDEDTG